MQSRQQQPASRQSIGKKRGLDIHPLSSGKKAIDYANMKMHTNPSPGRVLYFPAQQANGVYNSHPQATPDSKASSSMKDSRVLIRQNELVEFTKKFAVEKADYEDRIDELQRELHGLRFSNMKLDEDFKTLLLAFKHKEHNEFQYVKEIQAMKEELARLAVSKEAEAKFLIVQAENTKLRGELDQAKDKLGKVIEEARRLEGSERESARVIGERVFDIVKLSNQLDSMRRMAREIETQAGKYQSEWQLFKQQNHGLTKEIAGLKNQNQESQKKIIMLLEQISRLSVEGPKVILTDDNEIVQSEQLEEMRKQEIVELKRKVCFLQQQNQKLRERIQQQSIHGNAQEVVHQNKALMIQLNDRNKKIFDLSSQVGTLRKRIKSFSQQSSPVNSRLDNQALVAKCCELQTHIQTLNKKIIQLELARPKQIQNFEDIAFSQINAETGLPKPSNQASSASLQPSSSCASNLDQLYNQNEAMKMELDKLNQITAEHRALQDSIRNMEGLIQTLRKENMQLRGGSDRKRVLIKRNQTDRPDEDKNRELERDRTILKEENDFLKAECGILQKQMAELRDQLNNLRTSKFQKTLNTSSLTQSRQDRISFLMKKIAEYSREIVEDKDNPLQFQLYGTIFNKFIKHIEMLQAQRQTHHFGRQISSPRDPF